MDQTLISVTGCTKMYGRHVVLDGLDMDVKGGSVYGLVGLNGAGKTTLMRILLGLIRASDGVVTVLGHDPWRHEPALYRQSGVVLENDGFWSNLTFAENIDLFGRAKGISRTDMSEYLEKHWAGQEIVTSTKKVKFFSRGQRVQCGLCRAFLGWPKVCFLDEPTTALDVKAHEHFCALVHNARSRGSAVIISSHQLSTIEELCDDVGLLQNGRITRLDANERGTAGGRWVVKTDMAPGDEALLAPYTLTREYAGGVWKITADDPQRAVPAIVTALAAAGRRIQEVRPEGDDLRSVVRRMYE